MIKRILAADFKRIRALHLYALCAAFALVVACAYLFANGAWVAAPLANGGLWGFSAHPNAAYELIGGGFSEAEALASAALAHTVLFPLLALLFVYRLYADEVQAGRTCLSFSRGVSKPAFFWSKLISASIVLLGCYLAITLGVFATYAALLQPAFLAQATGILVGKTFACCLVNESFIALCLAVFSWVRSGPVAAGILFVGTVVGLIAQMSFPALEVPVHMAWWMRICGLDSSPGLALAVATFSAASFAVLVAAAYGGMIRQARR